MSEIDDEKDSDGGAYDEPPGGAYDEPPEPQTAEEAAEMEAELAGWAAEEVRGEVKHEVKHEVPAASPPATVNGPSRAAKHKSNGQPPRASRLTVQISS